MENNITNLFKAINYMNKKTLIPTFDEYIFIENGSFILQDAYKTYVYSLSKLQNFDNYFFSKEHLISLKTKNAKYFLEEIRDNQMFVKITTKNSEEIKTVPLLKKCINITNIISKDFSCLNTINANGMSLKLILSGYSDNLTFKSINKNIFINIGDDESAIDFNELFGDMCFLESINSDDSASQIPATCLVEAIGQFGLVKKNPNLNISFNEKCFSLNKENLTIYILSNHL